MQNTMGLNFRRRVIYQALRETFSNDADVRHFFELWHRDHSQETHFVVTRFAAVVSKEAAFDAERRSQFQRRLFHGLTQTYESLPRVPDAMMPAAHPGAAHPGVHAAAAPAPLAPPAAAPPPIAPPAAPPSPIAVHPAAEAFVARAAATQVADPPERVVFKAMAAQMVDSILPKADRQPGVLGQAVADLGRGLKGREQALHQAFVQWSATRFDPGALPPLRAEEELRQLIHLLYLLAADLLGPAPADRLLGQAASACESLPDARLFSPQQLL